MNPESTTQLVPAERIEKLIHLARGEKVLLDADLAKLYGVSTGAMNRAVRRNAFTEQGVAVLSSVLRSERAVQVNVAIMRAFVSLRRMLAANDTLSRKLAELERRLEGHDKGIKSLFDVIRELMSPPAKPRREIGFHAIGKETADDGKPKAKR